MKREHASIKIKAVYTGESDTAFKLPETCDVSYIAPRGRVYCTLPVGHPGKHVAHNDNGDVIETWGKTS